MSRITKQIAEDVAIKLLAKKYSEIKTLKEELSDKVKAAYDKTIPEDVVELSIKYPSFFEFRSYVRINGNGWNWQNIDLSTRVISKTNNSAVFEPEVELANGLKKLHNKITDKETEVRNLRSETENTLYSLRTYAKVSEVFPEAVVFLPKHENTSLIVNVNELREKLK